MESWIFLFIILIVGYISKNLSIVYPTIFVMILKFLPFTRNFMTILRQKGINWGIMVITVAILIPIATKKRRHRLLFIINYAENNTLANLLLKLSLFSNKIFLI